MSGLSFTNSTTSNGLGSNDVFGVYASGSSIYAATDGGLSISTNGGSSWTNYTTSNGLATNIVSGVYADANNVYAATLGVFDSDTFQFTDGGVSISTNGGSSWTNYTTTNGLGSNDVLDVYASGGSVYAATSGGLSISTNGGASWTNYTTASNGLGSNQVHGVYASGGSIYAATLFGGVSIAALSADPNPVPAPLPVLGSAVALGFCRRLRSHSQRLRHAAGCGRA